MSENIYISKKVCFNLDILHEFGRLECATSSIPMKHNPCPMTNEKYLSDPSKFRKLVGKLLYLTITRPNIAYPVNYLSQFLANPRDTHFNK